MAPVGRVIDGADQLADPRRGEEALGKRSHVAGADEGGQAGERRCSEGDHHSDGVGEGDRRPQRRGDPVGQDPVARAVLGRFETFAQPDCDEGADDQNRHSPAEPGEDRTPARKRFERGEVDDLCARELGLDPRDVARTHHRQDPRSGGAADALAQVAVALVDQDALEPREGLTELFEQPVQDIPLAELSQIRLADLLLDKERREQRRPKVGAGAPRHRGPRAPERDADVAVDQGHGDPTALCRTNRLEELAAGCDTELLPDAALVAREQQVHEEAGQLAPTQHLPEVERFKALPLFERRAAPRVELDADAVERLALDRLADRVDRFAGYVRGAQQQEFAPVLRQTPKLVSSRLRFDGPVLLPPPGFYAPVVESTALGLAGFASLLALCVPLYAWRERGRNYAMAAAVIMALSFPSGWVVAWRAAETLPSAASWIYCVAALGFAAGAGHLASLVRARLRPRSFRWLVSIPGMTAIAAGVLSFPVLAALLPIRIVAWGLGSPLPEWILAIEATPLALALLSVPTSLRLREEVVRIAVGDHPAAAHAQDHELRRVPVARRRARPGEATQSPADGPAAAKALRLVQITDPHLGPWQPIHRLRARVVTLLAHCPDLVLLTGDFLTMESRGSPGALAQALAPLRDVPGRCYAVFGNHDHEAPEEVRAGLEANGVRLLVDEEACVETRIGPVQILGSDWVRRDPSGHLENLLARHPRRNGQLRLLLLHDPAGFPALASGAVDLTLSGHTHGGQLGLLSFGFDWTVLSRSRWPDHGLFARGRNRLYVHRGTGFYGFPLRVGVPGEASLLEVVGSPLS